MGTVNVIMESSAFARPVCARAARFLALIGAHGPTLEAAARKLCREPSAAADLLQDTLERAWRHFASLRDEECARGWLLQILRNTWVDQLRRRRRTEVPIEDDHEPPAMAADEPSWWEQITLEDLRRAIAQLQEPFRSVAVLHDLHGHSYREIARLLEIPSATAATRLHRAHVRIRALLQRELDSRETAARTPPLSANHNNTEFGAAYVTVAQRDLLCHATR